MALRKRSVASIEKPVPSKVVEDLSNKVNAGSSGNTAGNRKLFGVIAAVIAVLSAGSDFPMALKYEKNIWTPLLTITVNFGITAVLALIIVSGFYSLI